RWPIPFPDRSAHSWDTFPRCWRHRRLRQKNGSAWRTWKSWRSACWPPVVPYGKHRVRSLSMRIIQLRTRSDSLWMTSEAHREPSCENENLNKKKEENSPTTCKHKPTSGKLKTEEVLRRHLLSRLECHLKSKCFE